MPQLYVLRRFSSWSFRLSVSVALLVSSAGLAASLLAGTALGDTGVLSLSWQPTTHPAQAASELSLSPPAEGPVLPAALGGPVPTYSFAAGTVAGAPVAGPTDAPLADQPVGAASVFPAAAGSLKTTMQRSWHTFKLAFR